MVVTAGDDSVIRVWTLSHSDQDNALVEAVIVHELNQHSASVSALHVHPKMPWLCSSGKDGKCIIWDLLTGAVVADIPCLMDLPGLPSATNKAPVKIETRGCCFSIDGDELFTIQSPRRGPAHLIKWSLEQRISKNSKDETTVAVSAVPTKMITIGKVPAIRLCISSSSPHIAVGSSDGVVTLLKTENLAKVKSFANHDLPVLGLEFAPSGLALETGM